MKDALVNNDTSVEQELETALARMFRPEEGVNAQAWVNWLNQVRTYIWRLATFKTM
jgi:hypothetical protein